MAGVEVRGKEQLSKLAAVLTEHAEGKTIRRRLSKAIRDQASEITDDQRKAVAKEMPKRGGLAATLEAQGRYSVRTSLSARSTGVTIVDSWKGHDMKAIDSGDIRHPVYARADRTRKQWTWVAQLVPAGTMSRQIGPRRRLLLAAAISREIDKLAAEIARET